MKRNTSKETVIADLPGYHGQQHARQQWYRVQRWYNRLRYLDENPSESQNRDYYEDVVYAFFQNCWHLKDWLIYSKTLERKLVDDFFLENPDLETCQAIAIGSKHLGVTDQRVRSDIMLRKRTEVVLNKQKGIQEFRFTIKVLKPGRGRGAENVVDLAHRCLALCEAFLKENSVI